MLQNDQQNDSSSDKKNHFHGYEEGAGLNLNELVQQSHQFDQIVEDDEDYD